MAVGPISNTITVEMSDIDLNNIKLNKICLTNDSCYISFTSNFISDPFNNSIVALPSNMAIPPILYIGDVTPPRLFSFARFDLSLIELTLNFSETVNSSTINLAGVTLQSFSDSAVDTLTLSSGMVSGDGPSIVITMSREDAIILKQNSFLCARQGICYLTLSSVAIKDMSGNDVAPVTTGLIVQEFIGDDMGPILESFNLDINSGVLTLSFDEIVDNRMFNPSGISITAGPNATAASYRLTGGIRVSNVFDDTIVLNLTTTDLNSIKATDFAKSKANTYITLEPSTIIDLSPESNSAQLITGLQVDVYTPDDVRPELLTFTVNMNENALFMTFTEPVDDELILVTSFTLHSAASAGISFVLTGGTITSMQQKTVIKLAFSSQDLIAFKYNGTILTSRSTSYLSFGTGAVRDTSGLAINEVTRRQADAFVQDDEAIALLSFSLNIFNGNLLLTFSDIANVSTFNASGITIQSQSLAVPSAMVTLTSTSTTASSDGLVLDVVLSATDRLNLTSAAGLASRVENTFITLTSSTVTGYDNNNVQPILNGNALQATSVVGGGNGTQLTAFTLDMNTGLLALSFNQPVDAGSFTPGFVFVQDSTGTNSISFTGGTAVSMMSGLQAAVTLTEEDLNTLKADEAVALSVSNTYLVLMVGSFTDSLSGNVTTAEPVQASSVFRSSSVRVHCCL